MATMIRLIRRNPNGSAPSIAVKKGAAKPAPKVSVEQPSSKAGAEQPLVEPLVLTLEEGRRVVRMSRSEMYRQLAAGNIRAVKSGRRTLILVASLRHYVESLLPATYQDAGRDAAG